MKILFLSPNQITRWNPGHQQFRNAISSKIETVYYGPGYKLFDDFDKTNIVPTVLAKLKIEKSFVPDIIMTYGYRYTAPFQGLGLVRHIPKVHFICDFTPAIPGKWRGTIQHYLPMLKNHGYDGMFSLSYQVCEWFGKNWPDMKVWYLPFGVDHEYFKPIEVEPLIDIFAGWSDNATVYPMRRPIENRLSEKFRGTSVKVLIKRVFGNAFVKVLNESRICLNTSNLFNTMNMKHFEVMACNSLLMTEPTQEFKDLGYASHVHYVAYTSPHDLVEKALYCLLNPKWSAGVANEGYEFTINHHTNNHRVEQMKEALDEYL